MANAKTLVQEQFGAHAAAYATSRVHAQGTSLSRLVEAVRPQAGWRALDVATGAGHTALAFAPHVADVIASDVTPEMLAQAARLAAERGLRNVGFSEAPAERLPFPAASFDLVTCRIAAHHFDDVPRFVREAARVLRRGGVFGLVDNVSPDVNMLEGARDALAGAAREYNDFELLRDPSHLRCLTVEEWLGLLSDAGLVQRHVELLDKSMAFEPWADQQGASADTKTRLRAMLTEGSPAFKAFIRPETRKGELWFTLVEAVIVAEKP